MAVIVRQPALIEGAEVWLETYFPSRVISAEERARADKLDSYLSVAIPRLEGRIAADTAGTKSIVRKWYLLGLSLREIIAGSNLVMSADVDSGDLWKAIWWYLPRSLRPVGRGGELPTYDVGHKRKDHLSLCYEISTHPWDAVSWLERWDDWHQISFRPTISRDSRVLAELGASISTAERYPMRSEFRAIVKALGDRFPTRRLVNTEVLSDEEVAEATRTAVYRIIGKDREA